MAYQYAFDVTFARLAFGLGILLSFLFYTRFKIAPGGMIVPGYLALFLLKPIHLFVTLFIAYLTYLIVDRIIKKHTILFGRKKFTYMIFTGFVMAIFVEFVINNFIKFEPFLGYRVLGVIIPGVIANEFEKEHIPFQIMFVTLFVATVTFLIVKFVELNSYPLRIKLFYFYLLIPAIMFSQLLQKRNGKIKRSKKNRYKRQLKLWVKKSLIGISSIALVIALVKEYVVFASYFHNLHIILFLIITPIPFMYFSRRESENKIEDIL
ncbi:poly-gamma-glutamate biosynthesis protein PgsC [Candidatus Woesearchaeota archaeon]|nr:poly-gamma-glutamate biosynthesis protein PgsC [Candidatus Woesearchaeota archaeon]